MNSTQTQSEARADVPRKLGSFWTRIEARPDAVTLTDDAPEWLRDACYEATSGNLNDWGFDACHSACLAIDDGSLGADRHGDDVHEWADGQVDVYTRELFQWATDHCLSDLYSQAESEAEDMGEGGTIVEQLTRIQYCALRSLASTLVDAWKASREEEDEEEDS